MRINRYSDADTNGDGGLSNADFVARAAVEVVTESRARTSELEDQIAKLKVVMENL